MSLPDARTCIDAGMNLSQARQAGSDGVLYVAIPKESSVVSLEHLMQRPNHIRQATKLEDQQSFIQYVNEFRTPNSLAFFDTEEQEFTAILDYHERAREEGEPVARWGHHIAQYKLRPTEEWKRWSAHNQLNQTQASFAAFLQENHGDIADELGERLYNVTRAIQIKKNIQFESISADPTTGSSSLRFEEDVQGGLSKGEFPVPHEFILDILPFVGGLTKYRVKCRLKFRLQDRAVLFSYDIVALDQLLRMAIDKIRSNIAEKTGLLVLAGSTEATPPLVDQSGNVRRY